MPDISPAAVTGTIRPAPTNYVCVRVFNIVDDYVKRSLPTTGAVLKWAAYHRRFQPHAVAFMSAREPILKETPDEAEREVKLVTLLNSLAVDFEWPKVTVGSQDFPAATAADPDNGKGVGDAILLFHAIGLFEGELE